MVRCPALSTAVGISSGGIIVFGNTVGILADGEVVFINGTLRSEVLCRGGVLEQRTLCACIVETLEVEERGFIDSKAGGLEIMELTVIGREDELHRGAGRV